MKLEIRKKVFTKYLDKISRAIVSSSLFPALQGILITVNETNIQLLASDGNLSIKEVVSKQDGINIINPGVILVPGRLFQNVIAKQGEMINIETKDQQLIITSDGTKTEINLFDWEEYPTISFDAFGKDLHIDASLLKELIKNVSFAAAHDDKRIILNGVNIKADNGELVALATNTFRLARAVKKIDSTVAFDITILSKNLKNFLPQDARGEIVLNVDDKKIITKIGTTTISSVLIDDAYLQVEKLFEPSFVTTLKIAKTELDKNIERATVLSTEGKKVVKMKMTNDQLTIAAKRNETGVSHSQTSNFEFDGEPLEIIFDSTYLKDALARLSDIVELKFNGAFKPFIVVDGNNQIMNLILPHRSF